MEQILNIIFGICIGYIIRSLIQIRFNRKMIKGIEETRAIIKNSRPD